MNRALVLGGGGITGIAWEIGIITGLADAGVDLRSADLVVGTSAGSIVGALVFGDLPLEEIYGSQLEVLGDEVGAPLGVGVGLRFVLAGLARDPKKARARLGRVALSAATASEEDRRRVFAESVPVREWPTGTHLLVTAVDAETGEPTVFDRDRGVPLFDAVAASCAVPLVWPPVTIQGRRYIDGGVRSLTNVDLVKGWDRVVVIAPVDVPFPRRRSLAHQLTRLGPATLTAAIRPTAASRRAIGRHVLQPARRALAAEAGRRQGREEAERVKAVWTA